MENSTEVMEKQEEKAETKTAVDETWFKTESLNGTSWSPFNNKGSKSTYKILGDGKKIPSPEDFATYYNDGGEGYYESDLGIIREDQELESRKAAERLPGGCYNYIPEALYPISLRTDTLIPLESSFNIIKKDIDDFLSKEHEYLNYGILYKLGILMYGPAGNGKSSGIRTVLNQVDMSDAIVLFFNHHFPSTHFLEKVKTTIDHRLKFFVFEELTETVDDTRMRRLLDFLDGEMSPNKCIVFATTNFPEKLPLNIVDRPSRFDKLYKFDSPNATDRKKIMEFFLKREVLDKEVVMTEKMSIASIKEACICVTIGGETIESAIKKLKDRTELCQRVFAKAKEIGYNQNKYDRW